MTTLHRDGIDVSGLFRARYLEMVRLAGLLGADDPADQEPAPAPARGPREDPCPGARAVVPGDVEERFDLLLPGRSHGLVEVTGAPIADFQRTGQTMPV